VVHVVLVVGEEDMVLEPLFQSEPLSMLRITLLMLERQLEPVVSLRRRRLAVVLAGRLVGEVQ
jgi:hypothetical protein